MFRLNRSSEVTVSCATAVPEFSTKPTREVRQFPNSRVGQGGGLASRGRLLGADDLARLGAVLRLREAENPVCVAAVRLLLLTGCRPGEIRCMRWCEVKPDR